MESLDALWIVSRLQDQRLGWRVRVEEKTTSTNDVAEAEANHGESEGLAVLAEEQTAGRGRAKRRWVSSRGNSLLLSVLLRPRLPASEAFLLTALAATAASAAIETATGLSCELKWPNDLVLGGRKVGGILTELNLLGEQIERAVVGIGLNVSTSFAEVPDLADTATSLQAESGRAISRNQLAVDLMRQMSHRYDALLAGDREAVFHEWRARLSTLGRRVRVGQQAGGQLQGVVEGWAEDVDASGALVLRLDDGSRMHILSGDVSLR